MGIYSVCISLSIFLNYADIGFISAANKYAGEAFAKNDLKLETTLHGFSAFVLFIFIIPIFSFIILCSYNPNILIANIGDNLDVASKFY